MVQATVIGFAGSAKEDFLIYLSAILTELGCRCMIVDYTEDMDYRRYLPLSENDNTIFTYRDVDYQFQVPIQKEVHQEYQVILLDVGNRIRRVASADPDSCNLVEHWYLVSDAKQRHLEDVIENAKLLYQPARLILKNLGEHKITGAYLRNILKSFSISFLSWYEIPFDMIDYEYALRLQYEHLQEFEYQSKAYKKTLFAVIENLLGCGEKELHRAYRRARKGRRRCR